MNIHVEVHSTLASLRNMASAWDELVEEDSSGLSGSDATSSWAWFEALVMAFPEAGNWRVLTAHSGSTLMGLMAIYVDASARLSPRLRAITELHGGRNGPLLRASQREAIDAMLASLQQACPGWVSLEMTLLQSAPRSAVTLDALRKLGGFLHRGQDQSSPYFPLQTSSESFKQGVSKSVLQTIRTARNKFAKLGTLSFRVYTQEAEADLLMHLILEIERQSWKHAAATAITTKPKQEAFYRALLPTAARDGLLYGAVLFLDDQPIAHNFGLVRQGVYICLKHSNVESFDKLSPNYVLNEMLFEALRERGVRTFDFMGLPEPHKLRWSGQTGLYTLNTWTAYSASLKGRCAAIWRRVREGRQTKTESGASARTSNA